jgi:hypothetical protein
VSTPPVQPDTPPAPKRIQLSRAKGWRKPEGAVVVSRPSGWGNPFKIGETYRFRLANGEMAIGVVRGQDHAVKLFRLYLDTRADMLDQIVRELGGRDLCCWCKPGDPCHADILLAVANGGWATEIEAAVAGGAR